MLVHGKSDIPRFLGDKADRAAAEERAARARLRRPTRRFGSVGDGQLLALNDLEVVRKTGVRSSFFQQ
jgi:hypothetical protein